MAITWYQVALPAKPNGQTGWVRASDVTVRSTDTTIHVYLAEHQLDLVVDGTVTMTAPVAIGSPYTPTPRGTFYITDPIDLASDPGSAYGAYALGISGYSDALDTFKGSLPQIAIHGTSQPQLIGKSVSNGCVRMTNKAWLISPHGLAWERRSSSAPHERKRRESPLRLLGSTRSHEAGLVRSDDRLRAVAHPKLHENRRDVALDRLDGDKQLRGDFAV